ncbi:hypothetical protein HPB51_013397 [Rhipicephalus microplus]|uniref:Uncharacterized protein n=1 Tax=Rhipicephalus microplus TaxID=6941 RepID=A0A9J6F2I5_RHIMP|nr:hypothetical protein HPB51_013397 [Rhipicephalus microplus]
MTDIINASIDALANVANVSVTPEELQPADRERMQCRCCGGCSRPYEVVPLHQHRQPTNSIARGVQEIRALYGLYATENRRLLGGRAALLLSQSLEDGVWQFYATYNGSWIGAFEVCSRSVHHIDNVWSKFVAELKDDPSKFDAMRTVFMRVKDAVYHERPPGPTLVLLAVAVPRPARSFSENLLRARAYNFEVYRVRVRVIGGNRGMNRLYYVGHSHIFLSAAMCDFVRSGPSSDIPNMAILGLLVAESVWSMILSYKKWTPSTLSSIERLAKCYVDNYFGTGENSTLALKYMPRALAMRSVLNAFDRPDWDTLRSAWSLLSMSHGEIFYSLVAYYRCPLEAEPDLMRVSNVPFAFAGDLAKVFHCESDSPMAKPQRCITGAGSRA